MVTNPFSQLDLNAYQIRTLDILEKAEPILLKYGYSKSTIDDIASAAKLGKGTIYLHWKSKDDLFQSLFYKIFAEIVYQVLMEVQKDKNIIHFDIFVTKIYRACYDRELIAALFTEDTKLLGRFLDKKRSSESQEMKLKSLMNSLRMYRQYHLIKEDIPIEAQAHTIYLLLIGIFTYDNYLTEDLSRNNKEMILENIIRNTFVPDIHLEIEDPIYNFILKSLEDLFLFYRDQVLNTTIK